MLPSENGKSRMLMSEGDKNSEKHSQKFEPILMRVAQRNHHPVLPAFKFKSLVKSKFKGLKSRWMIGPQPGIWPKESEQLQKNWGKYISKTPELEILLEMFR